MKPLERLIKLENDTRNFGFEWPNALMVIEQVISEAGEVKEAIEFKDKEHIQEEVGDLIHSAISLCMFLEFDVNETLEKTSNKFENRMRIVKSLAKEKGYSSLKGLSMEFLLQLWDEAKKQLKK